jgi:type IV pilus assembly protein PilC
MHSWPVQALPETLCTSDAIMRIRDDVATGQQLGFAMRQTGIFPSMALQMVAIGEESGALDDMLDKVATHFENEVDNAVDGLTSMMEPYDHGFSRRALLGA